MKTQTHGKENAMLAGFRTLPATDRLEFAITITTMLLGMFAVVAILLG
jgi:hypothetical protein